MVVEPSEAVSIDEDDEEEDEDDPSILTRVKRYFRKVYSPARY